MVLPSLDGYRTDTRTNARKENGRSLPDINQYRAQVSESPLAMQLSQKDTSLAQTLSQMSGTNISNDIAERIRQLYAEDYSKKYDINKDYDRMQLGFVPSSYDKKYTKSEHDQYLYNNAMPPGAELMGYQIKALESLDKDAKELAKEQEKELPAQQYNALINALASNAGNFYGQTEEGEGYFDENKFKMALYDALGDDDWEPLRKSVAGSTFKTDLDGVPLSDMEMMHENTFPSNEGRYTYKQFYDDFLKRSGEISAQKAKERDAATAGMNPKEIQEYDAQQEWAQRKPYMESLVAEIVPTGKKEYTPEAIAIADQMLLDNGFMSADRARFFDELGGVPGETLSRMYAEAAEADRNGYLPKIESVISEYMDGATSSNDFTHAQMENGYGAYAEFISSDHSEEEARLAAAMEELASHGITEREVSRAITRLGYDIYLPEIRNIEERAQKDKKTSEKELDASLKEALKGVPTRRDIIDKQQHMMSTEVTPEYVQELTEKISDPSMAQELMRGNEPPEYINDPLVEEAIAAFREEQKLNGATDLEIDNALRRTGYDVYLSDAEDNYVKHIIMQEGVSEREAGDLAAKLSDEDKAEISKNMKFDNAVQEGWQTELGRAILSIPARAVLSMATGVTGAVDLIYGVFDPSADQWEVSKSLMEASHKMQQFGTNDSYKGISLASDIGSEVLRMYATAAMGNALAGASTGGVMTAASLTTAQKGVRALMDTFAKTVTSQGALRMTPFVLSATGNYFNQAVSQGATRQQATNFAVLAGGAEGMLESVGADVMFQRALHTPMINQMLNGTRTALNSPAAFRFSQLMASAAGNAFEEGASYVVSGFLEKIIYNPEWEFSREEFARDAVMGGLIGIVGAGFGSTGEANAIYKQMEVEGYSSRLLDDMYFALQVENMSDETKQRVSTAVQLEQQQYAEAFNDTFTAVATIENNNKKTQKSIERHMQTYQSAYETVSNIQAQISALDPNGPGYANSLKELSQRYALAKSRMDKTKADVDAKITAARADLDSVKSNNEKKIGDANQQLNDHALAANLGRRVEANADVEWAGIEPYNAHDAQNHSSHKGVVANDMSFDEFVAISMNSDNQQRYYFGKVSEPLADEILHSTGKDVRSNNIVIKSNEIRHILEAHGDAEGEATRGQIPMTPEALTRLPEVFNNPDNVKLLDTKDYAGRDAIQVEKRINGYAIVINGISKGRHSLEVDSMWLVNKKEPPRTPDALRPPAATPETSTGRALLEGPPPTPDAITPLTATSETSRGQALIDNTISQDAQNMQGSIPLEMERDAVMTQQAGDGQDGPIEYAVAPASRELAQSISNAKKTGRRFYQQWVSGQAPLERVGSIQTGLENGKASVTDIAQMVRNSNGSIEHILFNALTDRNGNDLNLGSWKSVVAQIPEGKEAAFQDYVLHRHNIDRMSLEDRGYGKNKPVLGAYEADSNGAQIPILDPDGNQVPVTALESELKVEKYEETNPEFERVANLMNDWWDTFMRKWMVDGDLITEGDYDELRTMYPYYVPTYREGQNLGGSSSRNGATMRITDPIRKAKGSTETVRDVRDTFAEQVSKYVKAERKNELLLSLYNFAEQHVDASREYAVIRDADGNMPELSYDSFDDMMIETVKKNKDDTWTFKLKKNGEWKEMQTTDEIGKAINDLFNPRFAGETLGGDWLNGLLGGMRSATGYVKGGLTTYNPFFAITNAMRDFQTSYTNTEAGAFEYFGNITNAISEITSNGDRWKQYKALGGKSTGYVGSETGFMVDAFGGSNIVQKGVQKAKDIMSAPGEVTENVFRFAEYLQGLKMHGDTAEGRRKAIQMSADVTVNFSRSAPASRTLNAFVLYFNAQVQGIDKIARQMKSKPLNTLGKQAPFVAFAALLLKGIGNEENPHYQNLTNYVKDSNFLIPNVFGERDSSGFCTTFIKVPKSREYGAAIVSLFERSARWADGESFGEAFADLPQTMLTNLIPPNPLKDAVWDTAINAIGKNKNYYGGDIVPQYMQNEEAYEQYTSQTSMTTRAISETLHGLGAEVSPMVLDYLITQYGGFYGDAFVSLTAEDSAGPGRFATNMLKNKFVADPLYSSGIVSKFYDAIDVAKDASSTAKKKREELGVSAKSADEKAYDGLKAASDTIADLRKQERKLLEEERDTPARKKKIDALRKEINEAAKSALEAWENTR